MAAKVVVAAGLAVAVTAPAAFVAAAILVERRAPGSWRRIGYAVGAAVAAALYAAVFLALSLVTGRALAIGLIYVLVWEGLLAGLFEGTRTFSIRQYALGIADAIAGGSKAASGELLAGTTAVILAVVVCVIALAHRRPAPPDLRDRRGGLRVAGRARPLRPRTPAGDRR